MHAGKSGESTPAATKGRRRLGHRLTLWSVPDNVTTSTFTIMTTPSAPLRRLRAFFLLAQPPLLFQEGNTLSWQFIHTFYDRRSSAAIHRRYKPVQLLDRLTAFRQRAINSPATERSIPVPKRRSS